MQFGLRLAGIEYFIVNNKEQTLNNINMLLQDKMVGIIILTDNIYNLVESEINELEKNRSLPLFIKIPIMDRS